ALARQGHRFDRQQIAAPFGPREPGDLAHLILLFGDAVGEAPHAEILVEILRRDFDGAFAAARFAFALLQQQTLHHLAADLADFALELAHTGFTRVVTRDIAQRRLRYVQLVGLQAVVLGLLGQEILARDRDLLVLGVTR